MKSDDRLLLFPAILKDVNVLLREAIELKDQPKAMAPRISAQVKRVSDAIAQLPKD